MAYNNQCSDNGYDCTRIPYWSNPSVNYQGNPTGISQNSANSANNVLTLNNTAYTVANFRASISPSPQCDYNLSFYITAWSGKTIEDGYLSSSFSDSGYYFDICGNFVGTTSDYFYGELVDDSGNLYLAAYGTIIWNNPTNATSAYIQGGYYDNVAASYIDGTLKYSRGKYTLTAKGGASDDTFIGLYTSIKGATSVSLDEVFKKDRAAVPKKDGKSIIIQKTGKKLLRPPK